MIGRIVEVADDQRHLFTHRGFMVVKDTAGEHKELGQVPLDDIAAVIANAHGLSYTNNLLVALAERGAPFVLCAANHNVAGMLFPVDGNYQQAKRYDAQIAAGKPTAKRLWAEIVKAKLQQQASALEAAGAPHVPLSALVSKVRSGDPDNFEAQGARRYWSLLFGEDFRRQQDAGGLNAMLNYGYTVLRATTARAVVAAGLHPTLGLHHSNEGNAMRLVDDLMEPFRPIVDLKVWQLQKNGENEITPETKRALVRTMYDDMQTDLGATPVTICTQRLATSLAQVFIGEKNKLDLPLPGLPLALAAMLNDE
ncbi:MAG: type II CRISPR-associated endonuclease Cas1 [Azonexus sp.]|jgi:CRISPR-associated protein Cas1|uniref:type II CRISPR-associated endonuclease Cas1 n=1 Tax=Azonexus sp. TaxID=1872668 RepID=UPI00282C18C3|nr:type II CRISPR-associated endonuclease Cas1 [Azonexus sp.]MDR0776079.1 type II CRISPR-associated endonuclease Cas1 [Azonexus sp.]